MGWNIAWFALLIYATKEYGGLGNVMDALNAEVAKRKRFNAGGGSAAELEVSKLGGPSTETGRLVVVPVQPWGRREYLAVVVGVLQGLNVAVQEAPDLSKEVKAIVDQKVKELLAELVSMGIGGGGRVSGVR